MSEIVEPSARVAVAAPYAARPPSAVQRKRRRWMIAGVAGVLLVVLIGATVRTGLLGRLFRRAAVDSAVHVVRPGPLSVTLKEDGELKPVKSVDIKCEVQGQNVTIQFIVEESTLVKKGDVLVRLASSDMKDRVEMEEIELQSARSAADEAEQGLAITMSENASKLKKVEIDLAVAGLEEQRYLKGDWEKALNANEVSIRQARLEYTQKCDELEKSLPLLSRGFVTEAKIEELKAAIERAALLLETAALERRILTDYEFPKNKLQKRTAVEQSQEELDRERQRSESRERQARSKLDTQQKTLKNREQRFERLKEQLAKCEIVAPSDGMVHYGDSGGNWRWGGNRIAVGERVYDGQTLITLPDTSQMLVTTRIHEADRHKLSDGLTCVIRVPAVPGKTFTGKLSKIAQFADSERSWWNPELKEHTAEIRLDDTDAPLSPGDTAQVEILIEEIPDVLTVPVQCVFARGAKRFVFAKRTSGAEVVEIKAGRSSPTMIEVTEGLSGGDKVLVSQDEQLLALLPAAAGSATEAKEAAKPAPHATSQPSGG